MTSNVLNIAMVPGSQTQSQREQAIQDWLTSRLATLLRVDLDEIEVNEPFANYGLGSYQGVELAGDLGEWLGQEVSETLVWEYPTIAAVAQHLAAVASK